MIRINLLPTRELRKQAQLRQQLSIAGGILGLVILGMASMWWHDMRTIAILQAEVTELTARRDHLKPIVEQVTTLEKRQTLLNARLEAIQQLRRNQRGPVRVLDELSRNLPEQAWLDGIEEKAGVYRVTGYALTNFAVADLLRNLQHSKELTAVDLISSEQSNVAGHEIKKFAIQFQHAGSAHQPSTVPATPKTSQGKPRA